MYKKFIITSDGLLKFGHVHMHKDLLSYGEECEFGGGLWLLDDSAVVLYGRSYDFGPADFSKISKIEWSFFGGIQRRLVYMPFWPERTEMTIIFEPK